MSYLDNLTETIYSDESIFDTDSSYINSFDTDTDSSSFDTDSNYSNSFDTDTDTDSSSFDTDSNYSNSFTQEGGIWGHVANLGKNILDKAGEGISNLTGETARQKATHQAKIRKPGSECYGTYINGVYEPKYGRCKVPTIKDEFNLDLNVLGVKDDTREYNKPTTSLQKDDNYECGLVINEWNDDTCVSEDNEKGLCNKKNKERAVRFSDLNKFRDIEMETIHALDKLNVIDINNYKIQQTKMPITNISESEDGQSDDETLDTLDTLDNLTDNNWNLQGRCLPSRLLDEDMNRRAIKIKSDTNEITSDIKQKINIVLDNIYKLQKAKESEVISKRLLKSVKDMGNMSELQDELRKLRTEEREINLKYEPELREEQSQGVKSIKTMAETEGNNDERQLVKYVKPTN